LVNLPNLFTIVRIALAPLVAASILSDHYARALILCLIAGASDGLDGYLARRLGEITTLGAYLDPIADKILMATIYMSLGIAEAMPWWMVAVVFGRDIFILGMVGCGLAFTSIRRFPPTLWGKVSTVLQIAAALAVMGAHIGLATGAAFVLWLMIAATVWSGIHYGWRGLAMLRTAAE